MEYIGATPLIRNYEDFCEYNEVLKSKGAKPLNIERYRTREDLITVGNKFLSIEKFILDFLSQSSYYIDSGLYKLSRYDFSKIYYKRHPEIFLQELKEYADNLLLLGITDVLDLWEFRICYKDDEWTLLWIDPDRSKNVIKIPEFITVIESIAEFDEKKLGNKTLILPKYLKEIKGKAFKDRSIKEIIMPEKVDIIGDFAFESSAGIKKVDLSKGLVKLGNGVFRYSCITDIKLPDGLKTIPPEAFYNSYLKHISLPSSLTSIGEDAFYACDSLEEIIIPDGTQIIEGYAFSGCEFLKKVSLPSSLRVIEQGAFSDCGIEEIFIPDGVEGIGRNAFMDCKELKSVRLPNTLLSLDIAFNGCKSLEKVILPDEININEGWFDYEEKIKISIIKEKKETNDTRGVK